MEERCGDGRRRGEREGEGRGEREGDGEAEGLARLSFLGLFSAVESSPNSSPSCDKNWREERFREPPMIELSASFCRSGGPSQNSSSRAKNSVRSSGESFSTGSALNSLGSTNKRLMSRPLGKG